MRRSGCKNKPPFRGAVSKARTTIRDCNGTHRKTREEPMKDLRTSETNKASIEPSDTVNEPGRCRWGTTGERPPGWHFHGCIDFSCCLHISVGVCLNRGRKVRAPRIEQESCWVMCLIGHLCSLNSNKFTLHQRNSAIKRFLLSFSELPMETVGERIRIVRESKGLTQDQLATAAGISKSFVSEVENGKRNVSAQNLLRIANAMEASVEYLLRGVSLAAEEEPAAVTVPPELAAAAERLGLSFSATLDLLQTQRSVVARRGSGPSKDLTVENWIDLHNAIKKVFG